MRGALTTEISALRKEVMDLRDGLKLKNIVLDNIRQNSGVIAVLHSLWMILKGQGCTIKIWWS
jgi:hypothetical protein